ncbi:MAG TPA: lipoyl domain-containing protein [Bryobacteraceae bacterium]|nr:lipoyl domain-containing protein [Bryobacteraceae bacterium]
MKQIEVRVPKLGMDTVEAVVGNWLVGEGDVVAAGVPLVELESEKVTFAVESEAAGRLVRIVQPAGATVPVGDLLGVLEVE